MGSTEHALPETMNAVRIHAFDGKPESLQVDEIATPHPERGQVIIKMAASPINPSDLLFLNGEYGFIRPTPTIPGFIGAGRVVASGPGMIGRSLVGKPVACTAVEDEGTWAEYIRASALRCIKLPASITIEQGAMLLANPITAYVIFQEAKGRGHKAAIHTAAGSALGKILLGISAKAGYPVIHIVRRKEQVDELIGLGGLYVLNSSDPDFSHQLKDLSHQLGATIAFDAVAGPLTSQLMEAMPKGSQVLVYGRLSSDPMPIDPRELLFQEKSVEGFWLPKWIEKNGNLRVLSAIRKSMKFLESGVASQIAGKIPLKDIHDAIGRYEKNMSSGKILLVP